MFDMKVLKKDLKEMEKLNRTRYLEEERKKRIFNTKFRSIGIDEEALRKQLIEKRVKEDEEKALDNFFSLNQIYADDIAKTTESEEKQAKRRNIEEINMFRSIFQKKEPDLPEDCSNEGNFSVSSGQQFDGEDIMMKYRKNVQVEQQKNWLTQQIIEKRQKKGEAELAQKIFMDSLKAREDRVLRMDALEQQCRKRIEQANQAFNQAMERDCNFRKCAKNKNDINDKLMEIFNTVNSDLLTENPEVAQSALGTHRIIPYQYKGMSDKEKVDIREEQIKQIRECKKRIAAEEIADKEWNQQSAFMYQKGKQIGEYLDKVRREKLKEIMEENKLRGRENKAQMNNMKTDDDEGDFSEFLSKFNTSSR